MSLSGCAALLNSDRPAYSGLVVKPAWHDAFLAVEKTPLIYRGVVYAIAQDKENGRDFPRVFAFDVKNGTRLWASKVAAKDIVAVAGSELLVSDLQSGTHFLDLQKGERVRARPIPFSADNSTVVDGVFYATTASGSVEAWPVSGLPRNGVRDGRLWQRQVSKGKPVGEPVVTNGTVIVAASSPDEWSTHTKAPSGIYMLWMQRLARRDGNGRARKKSRATPSRDLQPTRVLCSCGWRTEARIFSVSMC